MLSVTKIECLNNFSSFILVKWTLANTVESLSDYTFNVYRSLAPDNGYEQIASGLTTLQYSYDVPEKLDSSVHLYFKVEAYNIVTQESKISDVFGATYLTARDNYAETIIYQHNYLLEHILQRPPAKLLIRKRTGTRCTTCWDEDLQEITKSMCPVCYSTGFVGGYMSPETVYISFTEPGFMNKFDLGDVRDVQQGITTAWMPNYPLVLPQDIIVDDFNRRFVVIQNQPTTKDGRIYLRQVLQLQLIPPTDIIYKINVGS